MLCFILIFLKNFPGKIWKFPKFVLIALIEYRGSYLNTDSVNANSLYTIVQKGQSKFNLHEFSVDFLAYHASYFTLKSEE